MVNLRNMPVSTKFVYAFGMVCGLCVLLGAYTFLTFHSIATNTLYLSDSAFPSVVELTRMRSAINLVRRDDLDILLCQNATCTTAQMVKRQKGLSDLDESAKKYEPLIASAAERAAYEKFKADWAKYVASSNKGVALMAANNAADGLDVLSSDATVGMFNTALDDQNNNLDLNIQEGTSSLNNAARSSQRATWINLGVTTFIMVLCGIIGRILTTLIAPRIATGIAALERMADKDLTVHAELVGTDEIGRLGTALNTCVESMRTVLRAVAQ